MNKFWKAFWIVYAFLFALIVTGGFLANLHRELVLDSFSSTLASLPALIALFAYAFRRKIWQSGVYFWRVYLFAFIAFNTYQDWRMFSKGTNMPIESWIGYGISLAIILFSYAGVYLYAFRLLNNTKNPMPRQLV